MGTPFKKGNRSNVGRPALRITHVSQAIILRELFDRDCSIEHLRNKTGLAESTLRDYIRGLRAVELVHIARRTTDALGRFRIKLYRWAPDTPDSQEGVLTHAQRSAIYRHRRKMKAAGGEVPASVMKRALNQLIVVKEIA